MTTPQRRRVGILLFPGFELLDVFGPAEMFGILRDQCELVLVAAAAGPVASAQGPQAVAAFGFTDCPHLDLLLVPGGIGTRTAVNDETLLAWIRDRVAGAEVAMTVCTGTSLFARAGVLDGHRATTNKLSFDWVVSQGPDVTWVRQARWVEDGKFATSSGVSAGMDMALAVIERLWGSEVARLVEVVTEYDRHRDASWDPFAAIHT